MRPSWVIAGIIGLGACAWIVSGQLPGRSGAVEVEATSTAPAERPPPLVRVDKVAAEPMVSNLILQGRTAADRKVEIRAETTGLIEEILVERGQWVTAGTPIVRVSTDDRQALLDEALAMLASQRIEFDAAQQLNERGYRAATQLAQVRAALDGAQAQVEIARIAVDNLTLVAPFDGTIQDRYVEVGDYVDFGDPIAQIVDLMPLRVIGQVSERYLGQIEVGAVGLARLVDGREVEGAISFVGSVADEFTRTYAVELEVENPDGRMIEGLTAELTLPIRQVLGHRVSPAVLSLAEDGTVGVKTVDADDRVVFNPVEILGGSDNTIWLGGLPASVKMIVVGQEFVMPGQKVRPVAATEVGGTDGGAG
ncbi:MAG: efflux RND transporter periplasmic adaptor subunit [Inquilinus sp.]|nr:efflux RND transporter periplasmic adaptor subunit [Inquilinus sp.]